MKQQHREQYPEWAKLHDAIVTGKMERFADLIKWLGDGKSDGYGLARRVNGGDWIPAKGYQVEIVCEYLGIDYDRAMRERNRYAGVTEERQGTLDGID